MSDDPTERFSDYVEVALDPSGAAQALTAAQARIAELEAERDAAHERGRLQGLDEAAEYCRTHTMDVVTRSVKADFAGAYIAGPVYDGGKHAGMGYAEALEALKAKGGDE